MRFCFILSLMTLAVSGVRAAEPDVQPKRLASVVRVDSENRRLVRTTVIAPRVIPEKVISSAPPPAPANPKADPGPSATVNALVSSIARRHNVEPSLVDSVIRVESNYDPNAVSPKGAMGLMQLIPSTARRFGVNNTFHPAQNIEGGVLYLKYLMNLYHGDERLALAAYNAGEGAVAKYNGIPPYPETQNYVYQVGKKLGQSREAERKAKVAAVESKQEAHVPVIERTVGPDGKEYYRTR
jgi:soluble lytic murein transglycosylase-like protein